MATNEHAPPPRTLTDPDTGEVFDLVAVPRRARYNGGHWIMVVQASAEDFALNQRLTDQDVRVFVMLLGRLDWENYLAVSVTELAREISRSRPSVSKSIGRLVEAGVLIKGPRSSVMTTYRLSPDMGWKGSHKGRSALQTEMDRRGWAVHEGGSRPAEVQEQGPEEVPGQTSIDY